MATTFSQVELINAALAATGNLPTTSENDGSVEWITLSKQWPLILEAELEDGNYNFSRHEVELLSRSAGKYGFDDAFAIPDNVLFVRKLWVESDTGTRTDPHWVSDEGFVYVNEPTSVVIEYVAAADPSKFGARFARGIAYMLEAVALRALKEETQEADRREEKAEFEFMRARANSSREQSRKPFSVKGQFVEARFRRGAR